MKNITTILEEAKVELTDEQKQAIENAVSRIINSCLYNLENNT